MTRPSTRMIMNVFSLLRMQRRRIFALLLALLVLADGHKLKRKTARSLVGFPREFPIRDEIPKPKPLDRVTFTEQVTGVWLSTILGYFPRNTPVEQAARDLVQIQLRLDFQPDGSFFRVTTFRPKLGEPCQNFEENIPFVAVSENKAIYRSTSVDENGVQATREDIFFSSKPGHYVWQWTCVDALTIRKGRCPADQTVLGLYSPSLVPNNLPWDFAMADLACQLKLNPSNPNFRFIFVGELC